MLLPEDVREERYREWAAELPAILHDPDIRSPVKRITRALRFAVSTHRSVPWTRGNVRKRAVDVFFVLLLVATAAYSWQDTCAVAGALIALPAAYRFGRSVFWVCAGTALVILVVTGYPVIDPGAPLVIAASLTILIRRAESRDGQLSR